MKKIFKEPLFHFLLIGAGLFLLSGVFGNSVTQQSAQTGQRSKKIIITQGQIKHMTATFMRTWQRPPTQQELKGLIDRHVRDEIGYREALAMGLDRDDPIIRRRMSMKLEMMNEDIAASLSPSDEALQTFMEEHADSFSVEPRAAFRHIYLSPDRRGAGVEDDARELLSRLEREEADLDLGKLSDPLLFLPSEFDLTSESEIARHFGTAFTGHVLKMEPGRWQGPVVSGYGLHLVFVNKRESGGLPALSDVREEVEREWMFARKNELKAALHQKLLEKYTVVIEQPTTSDEKGIAKAATNASGEGK